MVNLSKGREWMNMKGPDAARSWTPCPTCGVTCKWSYGPISTLGVSKLTVDCLNSECPTNAEGDDREALDRGISSAVA